MKNRPNTPKMKVVKRIKIKGYQEVKPFTKRLSDSKKKDSDKGLREILAFMKRLSEFEKRSAKSNPLVG